MGRGRDCGQYFAYDWLPKLDVPGYDILRTFELMYEGSSTAMSARASTSAVGPQPQEVTTALSKLKFLVIIDPLETETAHFWENHGEHNDVDTANIQTEVIQLPSTCFAEDEGSLSNSGRWLQWHGGGNAAWRGQA